MRLGVANAARVLSMLLVFSASISWAQEAVDLESFIEELSLPEEADRAPEMEVSRPSTTSLPSSSEPPLPPAVDASEPASSDPVSPPPLEEVLPLKSMEVLEEELVKEIVTQEEIAEESTLDEVLLDELLTGKESPTPVAPELLTAPIEASDQEILDEEDLTASGEDTAPEEQLSPEAVEKLAKQEEVRLQAKEVESLRALEDGYEALTDGEYSDAIRSFEVAIELPPRPQNQEPLQQARWGYAEANYYLAREQLKERIELDQALSNIQNALNVWPDHKKAVRLKDRLEKTLALPKPKIPVRKREAVTKKAKTLEELLDEGKQHFSVRDYEQAEVLFDQVLVEDEYNLEAMRFLKKIAEKKYRASSQERKATAADMTQEVREKWNPPSRALGEGAGPLGGPRVSTTVSGSRKLEKRMQEIVIPSIEFRQANIVDVVDFLVEASIAGDADAHGVNIILNLKLPNENPAAQGEGDEGFEGMVDAPLDQGGALISTITLNLRRVSLLDAIRYITEVAGLKYRIEENAVIITPAGVVYGQVITRLYPVQPSILDVIIEKEDVDFDTDDDEGFGFQASTRTTIRRGDVKDFFQKAGVPFPVGTSITYNAGISKLIVANTPENHDKLERVLAEINLTPSQVEIEARFVEVAQNDLEELGLEWLLTDDYEIASKRDGSPVGQRERVQVDANASEGGFTRGLRFLNLDSTLGSVGAVGAAFQNSSQSALGNIVSVSTILTNPELNVVLHALSQKANTDLLSAPRVTTRTGQSATIQVVQEIIYPTEFEQDIQVINQELLGDSQFVVVTPGAFQTRPIGVILNVTPTVAPDGFTIDLTLAPEVAELEGWLDFGSTFPAVDAGERETQRISIPQPIFSSRNVSTSISIWDGQTVVMGGAHQRGFDCL